MSLAFTRLELAVALAALSLLAAVTWPALANTRPHSQRVACLNNLSRIGQAYSVWTTEHDGRYPWQISTFNDGGSIPPTGLQANVWFQFLWISNELATPKVLACPSDSEKKTAMDFSGNPLGGFLHANYRNNAISYVLSHPFLQEGRGVLSGDRNFPASGYGVCPYFVNAWFVSSPPSGVQWVNRIHVDTGNLLFNDGSVEQADNTGLRASLTKSNDDNAASHFLFP